MYTYFFVKKKEGDLTTLDIPFPHKLHFVAFGSEEEHDISLLKNLAIGSSGSFHFLGLKEVILLSLKKKNQKNI